jgi:ribosomal protein S18 acetylase RimI-like enzyme
MNVLPLSPSHLPELYSIYRTVTARAAHSRFVPSFERFSHALSEPKYNATKLFVAEDQGKALGFAAYEPRSATENGLARASITALFSEHEDAAQALLSELLTMANQFQVQQLEAFPAHHFHCPVPGHNAGWDALSDTMPMIARVLARNGFMPTYRELLMICDFKRFPPSDGEVPEGLSLRKRVPTMGGWELLPHIGQQRVGSVTYGTLAQLVDHEEANQVGYLWGISVIQPMRRRGIARYLTRRVMTHFYELGCSECWLSTGAQNFTAQPLYLSLGFEVADATVSFQRLL